jgi:hypothetical protein
MRLIKPRDVIINFEDFFLWFPSSTDKGNITLPIGWVAKKIIFARIEAIA